MIRVVSLLLVHTVFLTFNPLGSIALGQEPWQRYLDQRTRSLTASTIQDLKEVTKENWDSKRLQWRDELQDMLGLKPWPAKTPLDAKIEKRWTVEGVKIENLHFQSRPGLYVCGNLYLPDRPIPQGGFPTVLYVCGHANVTDEGRLLGNKTGYHHHGLWMARQGVVCFIIDTIQLGELHGEHHGTYKLGRWDWISRGYTPAGVEAWNGIRALDYLESRPEVDAKRIGITGRSGGGAYSWFTAALDDRIRAAVPVAGITDLQNHIIDGCVEGHCDCMYFVNEYGWDYPKLAALIAPRPLLLTNTDSDTIFPLDGVMRIHWLLTDLYKTLGKSNAYGVLVGPGPHKDTQELQVGALRWLLSSLVHAESLLDSVAKKELAPMDLVSFPRESPKNERVTSIPEWFVATESQRPESSDIETLIQNYQDRLFRKRFLAYSTIAPEVVQSGVLDGQKWSMLRWGGDDSWSFYAFHVEPQKPAPSTRSVFHIGLWDSSIDPEKLSSWLELDRTKKTLHADGDAHHWVVFPRGWDSERWGADIKKRLQIHRRFYLLGESIESLQWDDCMRCLDYLQPNVEANGIEIRGYHRSSPLACLVAWSSRLLKDRPISIESIALEDYPTDARYAPTLPGFNKWLTWEHLQQETARSFPCKSYASSTQPTLRGLVDTSSSPQQATGIRIVEVQSDRATIWGRATRWSLPNLGDLASVHFAKENTKNPKQSSQPILPADGTAGLRFAVPGVDAELRVRYRPKEKGTWKETPWVEVHEPNDFSNLFALNDLTPNTSYDVVVESRAIPRQGSTATHLIISTQGSFRTLPLSNQAKAFRIAIGTCQEFEDRDGPHGFDLYRTLLHRKVDAYFLAGDVVYYDALARSVPLAHYHWQRTYSLPTMLPFHRRIPTYFLKDDHDTYTDDSWPSQKHEWTDSFTFEEGQRIFREQTGLPTPAYRTLRFGKDLEIWCLEGRDYRSPNSQKDSSEKSILGAEQKKWLQTTLPQSNAKYKVVLSPTPIVGPDRENKKDNLSNSNFATEGKEMRSWLSQQPNTFVICGDRHWQYHSVDPQTGLQEFSVGPVSNRHAGGWKQEDFRKDYHQFLRVGGGYLELQLDYDGDQAKLKVLHLDPYGEIMHEVDR